MSKTRKRKTKNVYRRWGCRNAEDWTPHSKHKHQTPNALFEGATREKGKTTDAIRVYKNTEAPDAVLMENKNTEALDAKEI